MARRAPTSEFMAACSEAAPVGGKKIELALRRARAEGVLLLADCGLDALPPRIFDLLSTVESGELSLNCCSSGELTKLDLSHNAIAELPSGSEWEALASLAVLRAHDNRLAAPIDQTLCRLRALERLDLSSNRLTGELAVSGLAVLELLRELDVSSNQLIGLGPDLPVRSLETLRVSHNRLLVLPSALEQCSKLRTLVASHNALTGVSLALSQLVELELSNNQLSRGGCDFTGCAALELLDVRDNGLVQLPPLPRTCSLVRLFAGHNRIELIAALESQTIPSLGPALAELHLNDNRLRALPAMLAAELTGLKVLALANNELGDLPHELGYLPKLTRCQIDGNPMRQIRRPLWSSCEALKKHLRSRGPPPSGSIASAYLPEDADSIPLPQRGGGAQSTSDLTNSDEPTEMNAAEATRLARDACSGARVLDVSSMGLRALPLDVMQALASTSHNPGGLPFAAARGGRGGHDILVRDRHEEEGGGEPSALGAVLELRCARSRLGAPAAAHVALQQDGMLRRMRGLHTVDLCGSGLTSLLQLVALRSLSLSNLLLARNALGAEAVEELLCPPSPSSPSPPAPSWVARSGAIREGSAPGSHVRPAPRAPMDYNTSWGCALTGALALLDLSANRLERMPACALALPRVHTLLLASNGIRSLAGCWPVSMHHSPPRALAHLDLGSNRIVDLAELPHALLAAGPTILTLSLESNELSALPPVLGQLTSLHTLLVGANPQKVPFCL
ncbi:hypothetical protein T492DRAFT_1209 [Pavlovales sp. CCMP2436]|nr:hypothetical protein T492DRAFT_1209 [Pavlovales sp. CCMP2436]